MKINYKIVQKNYSHKNKFLDAIISLLLTSVFLLLTYDNDSTKINSPSSSFNSKKRRKMTIGKLIIFERKKEMQEIIFNDFS